MRNSQGSAQMHGTTVLCVRKDNKAVLIADGQVTMGDHVMKHTARKTRRLYNDKVVAGFAGSTADAISLFERFEGKLQEFSGNLQKSAVELAKEWRKDRALRHLEALLIVADTKSTFLVSGNGDVIEPDDGICAIGSGGPYALAAARALAKHTKLSAKDIASEAMRLASEICIFTNGLGGSRLYRVGKKAGSHLVLVAQPLLAVWFSRPSRIGLAFERKNHT